MKKKTVEDVQTAQDEMNVDAVVQHIEVMIPRTKKKYKVRCPLTNSQLEALARLLFKKGGKAMTTETEIIQDTKIASKAAAIYLTPGFWKRKLTYWLKWRWFYYIKQYDNAQLQPIISAGYGSTPYIDFLKTASILANQKTAQMRMRVEEAEKVMQEMAMKFDQQENVHQTDK